MTTCRYRSKEDEDFFAVYDGHGGDKASLFAAQRHPEILAEQLSELEAGIAKSHAHHLSRSHLYSYKCSLSTNRKRGESLAAR